ncbi:DUF721 domain-containing protein [Commensalibacter oyaizuii]|uniref:DUF721 domain-containing protein n=1 Tax=Commensalibacter oyaizuii TaxID=3043873 RepID=A0ABT6Q446_9PROT|nr:DUF721 domain-containing protein [Commensalibacter sp. TBRC 16381]MDI2091743.1 DUF721 domain-containing protein [Commensalibacter sp. TBRC 16381]
MCNTCEKKQLTTDDEYNIDEYPVNKTEKRSYDMYQIASTVHRVTRPVFKKKSPTTVQIMSDWIDIIGHHYGKITIPHRLYNGTLTIACSSTTAAEMHYIAQNIIQKINLYCGRPLVKNIKFLTSQNAVSFLHTPSKNPKPIVRPIKINDLPEGPLQTALARLGGLLQAKQKGNYK